MRIYLQLSANREIVPFNYQQSLVGAFHKWLGENELHDDISLYSLSWLSKGVPKKGGLDFPKLLDTPAAEIKKLLIAWGYMFLSVQLNKKC